MSNTPKLVIASVIWLAPLFAIPLVLAVMGNQVAIGFVFFEAGAGLFALTCVAMVQIVKYLESRA